MESLLSLETVLLVTTARGTPPQPPSSLALTEHTAPTRTSPMPVTALTVLWDTGAVQATRLRTPALLARTSLARALAPATAPRARPGTTARLPRMTCWNAPLATTLLTELAACTACEAGHYCPSNTTTEAAMYASYCCGAGMCCPTGEAAVPSIADHTCPTGQYCPEATSAPVNRPVGTFNTVTGWGALSDCVACDAGYYCLEGSTGAQSTPCPALPCPADTYPLLHGDAGTVSAGHAR